MPLSKFIAIVLLSLLLLLQWQLWLSRYGQFQLSLLHAVIAETRKNNTDLAQRNERLHVEIMELKQGRETLEARARSQLGFIKEKEHFYQLLEASEEAAQ